MHCLNQYSLESARSAAAAQGARSGSPPPAAAPCLPLPLTPLHADTLNRSLSRVPADDRPQAMCGAAGLPFEPAMLNWPAGPKPYDGLWAPWWCGGSDLLDGVSQTAAPVERVSSDPTHFLDGRLATSSLLLSAINDFTVSSCLNSGIRPSTRRRASRRARTSLLRLSRPRRSLPSFRRGLAHSGSAAQLLAC